MIAQNEVKLIIAQSHIACTIISYQSKPKQNNANHTDQAARKTNI